MDGQKTGKKEEENICDEFAFVLNLCYGYSTINF